jgi:hypothetical protein
MHENETPVLRRLLQECKNAKTEHLRVDAIPDYAQDAQLQRSDRGNLVRYIGVRHDVRGEDCGQGD